MIASSEMITWGVWLAVCVVNVSLAGLFAGMETGVYLINRVRMELQAETGLRSARQLQRFLRDPDHVLGVLLIGTNLHQYIAAFAVSAMFVLAGAEDRAEWYTLAVTTPLLFVFKDSLPKNLFQRAPERLVHGLIGPMRVADILFQATGLTVLVRLCSGGLLRLLGRKKHRSGLLGHEGLLAVLAEGHAVGALSGAQRDMAHRVIRIGRVHVSDVLQPMAKVFSAPAEIDREAFLSRIAESDYSRVPLLDAAGQVTGVVDIYDVLADESPRPIIVYAAEPLRISADATVTQALYTLQRAKRSLAVVADGKGRHVGIVTIKDLVEEIVGELDEW